MASVSQQPWERYPNTTDACTDYIAEVRKLKLYSDCYTMVVTHHDDEWCFFAMDIVKYMYI